MAIFTNTKELVDLSMHMMRILALGYIAMAVTQCLSGVMRGAGDTITPMWISLFTTVIIRVPVAYGLAYLTRSPEYPTGRPESIFISLLTSWVMGAIINTIFYKKGIGVKRLLLSKAFTPIHSSLTYFIVTDLKFVFYTPMAKQTYPILILLSPIT